LRWCPSGQCNSPAGTGCQGLASQYHYLRLRELEFASDFEMMVQAEREAERERKAELREQKKAEQELQAERARLEKE
jgi:hypothetical protein